jgi:hypothetical protein
MRAARLQELEEMAAELLATARKLPPSQERHEIFQEIGKIRAQIDALKAKGNERCEWPGDTMRTTIKAR